ncbi:adenylate/guanylate cyclase domain-containing protein [Solimonas sp. K1W22B-7]|uniref:adenylate/guanylate cyclase domain-containing protein n=1 Tax=Solimonas sp. K1W22B-7 TaxID=2303331 RepID=UPI000E33063A|nr:adenylate/guanylate cyclase domain-containing protein [Solimonas sp. K1W22B-7]AXQ30095.1 adenylate/guanylate cyclase domain-containing protein [Solimonas sp. K1W22B-7]
MDFLDSAHFIVALVLAGTALIFAKSDLASRSTRSLSLCLLCMGVAVLLGEHEEESNIVHAMLTTFFKAASVVAGIEWGRRISRTARGKPRAAANGLFIAAHVFALIWSVLALGYILVLPEQALKMREGIVDAGALELAVGAPLIGLAMLCAAIAIVILRLSKIDAAEMARLRALFWAAPFLLAGLAITDALVPFTLTIGLLIFLAGSVAYFSIQASRGAFMKQFLSTDVARMVQTQGLEAVLKRERRPLSIVVCDLRGFTAFAAEHDSDEVTTVLERFYEVVGNVAGKYDATVKDHAGDGVLLLVGAPLVQEHHESVAVRLAVDLLQQGRDLLRNASPRVGLGIGVAAGNTTIGAIRGAGRLEYVAVGNAVNLAARLCQRALDGEILISQSVAAAMEAVADHAVEAGAPLQLKGFAEAIPVHNLVRVGRADL